MSKFVFIGVSLIVFYSCNSGSEIEDLRGKEVESTIAAEQLSEKELQESLDKIRKEEAEKERLIKEAETSLEFDKLVHNFGNVKPEVANKTTFTVKNTGSKPLIIENVEASCGCTTPVKPEAPILPGKTDVIEVTFKSNPGQMGEQKKTVTVTANTPEKTHKLEIKAFVKE